MIVLSARCGIMKQKWGKKMIYDGAYDSPITTNMAAELAQFEVTTTTKVAPEEFDLYLSYHLMAQLGRNLSNIETPEEKLRVANELLEMLGARDQRINSEEILRAAAATRLTNVARLESLPEIPLAELALLTNAKGEPVMGSELPREIRTSDRVDILMAFVRVSGLNKLYEAFLELKYLNVPVRLITSTYLGATEKKALDQLVSELNVDVKIDYLARSNRLHAKAWLMRRNTGYSTAFVGSSNISDPALYSGLEWNVRLTEARSPEILRKISATFSTYWNSDSFESYKPEIDGPKLEEALHRASGRVEATPSLSLSMLDVRPYPHQTQMLEEIEAARLKGRHKNLIVAATGTGKTVLAAFDFQRFLAEYPAAKLLFVAHRREILEQSISVFRQVLKDPSFGELLVDGNLPGMWNHVFASIQSLNAKRLSTINASHFDFVVVDEFHHGAAPSYKLLMDHLLPKEMIGLTATPERSDGTKVHDLYFDGEIATEVRLWDALDLELVAPFSYFGIGESTNFKNVAWANANGYDTRELSNLVTGNQVRDRLLLDEMQRKISDLGSMKALIFCVDINHADYMAKLLVDAGIRAAALTSQSPGDERQQIMAAFRSGQLQALCSVDILNEGVDVPDVNVVIMLRPTASPIVFLQQLGRGLRRSPGKSEVLVLDFIGAHRAEYRIDLKLAALTGLQRGELSRAIESGFPYLPSGLSLSLDRIAKEHVLANLKSQVRPTMAKLVEEIATVGTTDLEHSSALQVANYGKYTGTERPGVHSNRRVRLKNPLIPSTVVL